MISKFTNIQIDVLRRKLNRIAEDNNEAKNSCTSPGDMFAKRIRIINAI